MHSDLYLHIISNDLRAAATDFYSHLIDGKTEAPEEPSGMNNVTQRDQGRGIT